MTGIAPKIGGGGADTSLEEIQLAALGLQAWNYPPNIATQTAFGTQTLYAIAVPVRVGMSISNILVDVEVAASGTVPTSVFFGLASIANIGSIGSMLARSTNRSGDSFAQGLQPYPLSAPYVIGADGHVVVTILVDGTWSVTQPLFGRSSGRSAIGAGGAGTKFLSATAGTAQTALPAPGGALPAAYTIAGALGFWVGLA